MAIKVMARMVASASDETNCAITKRTGWQSKTTMITHRTRGRREHFTTRRARAKRRASCCAATRRTRPRLFSSTGRLMLISSECGWANPDRADTKRTGSLLKNGKQGGKILVGTASWSDPGFVEFWYPKKMRPADRLGWYAQHFTMVEVNSTFYSVPDPMLVGRWCDVTPHDFVFNIKLHQLLSYHSTPAKLLPAALQKKLHLEKNGKVVPTAATVDEMLRAIVPSLEVVRRP